VFVPCKCYKTSRQASFGSISALHTLNAHCFFLVLKSDIFSFTLILLIPFTRKCPTILLPLKQPVMLFVSPNAELTFALSVFIYVSLYRSPALSYHSTFQSQALIVNFTHLRLANRCSTVMPIVYPYTQPKLDNSNASCLCAAFCAAVASYFPCTDGLLCS
jgi:hypothetical protein